MNTKINQSDQLGHIKEACTQETTLGSDGRNAQVCISSQDVLRGQSAVEIEHNGNFYRLQTTRQGKLILTK